MYDGTSRSLHTPNYLFSALAHIDGHQPHERSFLCWLPTYWLMFDLCHLIFAVYPLRYTYFCGLIVLLMYKIYLYFFHFCESHMINIVGWLLWGARIYPLHNNQPQTLILSINEELCRSIIIVTNKVSPDLCQALISFVPQHFLFQEYIWYKSLSIYYYYITVDQVTM